MKKIITILIFTICCISAYSQEFKKYYSDPDQLYTIFDSMSKKERNKHNIEYLVYETGDTYIGQTKKSRNQINSVPDGVGVYIFEDGSKISGIWKDGKPVEVYKNE